MFACTGSREWVSDAYSKERKEAEEQQVRHDDFVKKNPHLRGQKVTAFPLLHIEFPAASQPTCI